MKKSFYFSLFGAAAFGGFAGCDSGAGKKAQQPNIIFIIADDIGYGDLSCYGASRVNTPNIDRVASNGIRFLNAHSGAATSTPSRYALLTGQYSFRRNDTGILPGNAPSIIKQGQKTVQSMLQYAGYTTAVVGKWHLGLGMDNNQNWNEYIAPGPKESGFDYSYIIPATGDRVPCVFLENQRVENLDPSDPIEINYREPFEGEPLGSTNPELLTKMVHSHGHDMAIVKGIGRIGYMKGGKQALWDDEMIADSITSKAVTFIERNKEKPFFLYFATHDIHVPRVPHQRFVGKTGMGPRGDAILSFDWSIGRIVDALERNGLLDNTIIIITSDNGPVLDDGYRDQVVELLGDHNPRGTLRGGKGSLFEAGTCIPFIVSWPKGGVKKGDVSDAYVSHLDFFASMAALTGLKIPEDAAPDSFNQLKAWLGKDKVGREYIMEHAGGVTVKKDGWKYIPASNRDMPMGGNGNETGISTQHQLYNLKEDRGEQNNLAYQHPAKVEELATFIQWIRNTPKTRP
ncbi:MAG: arylsulfatase [Tannerella sp.]|jgi:arylsulfatase A-like enzyme|nr:arylsulfatase [Tannerella sp.]